MGHIGQQASPGVGTGQFTTRAPRATDRRDAKVTGVAGGAAPPSYALASAPARFKRAAM
jgi:hypothetical protein